MELTNTNIYNDFSDILKLEVDESSGVSVHKFAV